MSECRPPAPGQRPPAGDVMLFSVITCPHCGTARSEQMPADACVIAYDCTGCSARLRPRAGDCCVFCSFGSVPCPPVQTGTCCG